ncbi:MAG: hypothetical protein ACJAR3_001789 [Roseivirga sp.]|jgi:hypothetical protein
MNPSAEVIPKFNLFLCWAKALALKNSEISATHPLNFIKLQITNSLIKALPAEQH